MPSFTDTAARTWTIALDGLLLNELRDTLQIDLADVVNATYLKLESDPAMLTKALAFLCREQLTSQKVTERDFSRALIGRHLDEAFTALWGAAELFFPQKLFAVLSSRLNDERTAIAEYQKMRPVLLMFNQPEVPADLREQVWSMLGDVMRNLGLQNSQSAALSVFGQANTPQSAA